ncbi:hypothetical protein SCP_1500500 [Sparassis crispa]|uniref:Uncharacterized protein n=1 Tax=Sparassis crispa TaxID=139825 RepID=A0A401H3N7_9APHY|nr:hypothetical protein SCP_1500500 [Sparassis crispa]GBE89048.1 hypothetical protein SCP_1500500 [Sparassis crispa]
MTAEKAHQLLDPADKQNVLKAVNLIQELLKLKDHEQPPTLPSEAHRRHMLTFLARLLGCFVLPFISTSLSLAEQIRSLVTYAHLLAAMWIKHGTSFTTGALYADSQAIIKNLIFCILRLQLIDENILFYIILEGTDRLEALFSDCRTQDHSRNFDVCQLCDKLSISALLSYIFERNQDLDRGHRCLNLKDAMGVDHVNPKSWTGDVKVGHAEVASEWRKGRVEANNILREYFGPEACVDFDALFGREGYDLLRPSGSYVGVKYDPDDARTENPVEGSTVPVPMNVTPGSHSTDTAGDSDDRREAVDDSETFDDVPEGMDLDDFMPDTEDDSGTDKPSFHSDQFLLIEGKTYLKSSVVTSLLTSNRSRKVTMRTLRARDDIVKFGDIAACLVRVGQNICLGVLEITGFERGTDKGRLTAVKLEDLEKRDSDLHVTAQLLELVPQGSPQGDNSDHWFWTHQYIRFGARSQSERSTHNQHILTIPAFLVHPLGPSVVPFKPLEVAAAAADDDDDSDDDGDMFELPCTILEPQPQSGPYSGRKLQRMTWSLQDAQLNEILNYAWEWLSPDTEEVIRNVDLLPSVESASMPYKGRDRGFSSNT